jgi:hypothetical protein
MAEVLQKPFGAKGKCIETAAGQTRRADQPTLTEKHVHRLRSFKSTEVQEAPGSQENMGPWYIGKTIADIF